MNPPNPPNPPLNIHVEDDRAPDADVRLTRELFAGLPVTVPDPEREAGEAPARTVVARRPDGGLLGWAEVYDLREDGQPVAAVQWVVVSRERERIVQGHGVTREATPEEKAVAARLVHGVATGAGAAGYAALEWDDPERLLGARDAAELGASPTEELNRRWALSTPPAGWTAPAGLPAVSTRPVPPAPGPGQLSSYADFFAEFTGQPYTAEDASELLADVRPFPHTALDLLAPDGRVSAQVVAVVEGGVAQVDAVFHRKGTSAGELTALLAALIGPLCREHPGVTALEVQDLGDPVVAEALAATDFHVVDRWYRYRLPL
ncbi:hypothetical protein [Streptomyces sp. NPDC037389]|uniref:hypothetical protein n=1 Tax=Streptomyces sp. NPDC037389 TaxID=3155369 RepID=UPI003405D248